MSVQQDAMDAKFSPEDLSGDFSPQSLVRLLEKQNDCYRANFCSLKLVSKFQRVFSSTLQRGVGFEAFCMGVDPKDGTEYSSSKLFSKVCKDENMEMADRLRLLLHLKNFQMSGIDDRWFFTNLHPRVMLGHKNPDPAFLEEALNFTNISPNQVVVALREHTPDRQAYLAKVIGALRELGCLVVFDDFLSESANLDSLWKLRPDIVKLKRTWLENATKSSRAKRMLSKLVSLVHAAGSLVIIEQIETEEEAFMAMRMEADFVQGRFWGPVDEKPIRRQDARRVDTIDQAFAALLEKSEEDVLQDMRQYEFEMGCYSGDFLECAWSLADGVPLADAANTLLHSPRVERVYLLNDRGMQTEPDIFQEESLRQDPRYKPLRDSTGATWTRRFSFHDAIHHPGVVQLSPPYRSSASRNICSTLSVTVYIQDVQHVLCCDVEWRTGIIL